MQALRARAADHYETLLSERPNPLEASWEAQRIFTESAARLVRPGGNWSFKQEHPRHLLGKLEEIGFGVWGCLGMRFSRAFIVLLISEGLYVHIF